MKIIFDKIITNKDTLKISLDNGITSVEKPVSELLSNGYSFTEDDCLDLNNIQLGNKSVKKPSFTAEQNNVFKNITRWVSMASADLKAYLESMPDNTIDTPYAIKLLDVDTNFSNYETKSNILPYGKYFKLTFAEDTNVPTETIMHYCQTLVSLVIPSSWQNLYNGSTFADCINLREVILPDTVKKICYSIFQNTGITTLIIPASVVSLDYANINTLDVINYRGTEEQWNAIQKNGWSSWAKPDLVINYNYQG